MATNAQITANRINAQSSIQRMHRFHLVHSLDTDHAAYFSRPAALAALLHRIAEDC